MNLREETINRLSSIYGIDWDVVGPDDDFEVWANWIDLGKMEVDHYLVDGFRVDSEKSFDELFVEIDSKREEAIDAIIDRIQEMKDDLDLALKILSDIIENVVTPDKNPTENQKKAIMLLIGLGKRQ